MHGMGASVFELAALAQAAGETGVLSAPGAPPAVDFSVYTMFIRATLVVQVVMVMMVVASFWSWAIIIEKVMSFARLRRQTSRFEDDFWSGQPLDELF
ncbi:MAG: hypothetical protein AAF568_00060, partial [Pseudomonadota bacterium]